PARAEPLAESPLADRRTQRLHLDRAVDFVGNHVLQEDEPDGMPPALQYAGEPKHGPLCAPASQVGEEKRAVHCRPSASRTLIHTMSTDISPMGVSGLQPSPRG